MEKKNSKKGSLTIKKASIDEEEKREKNTSSSRVESFMLYRWCSKTHGSREPQIWRRKGTSNEAGNKKQIHGNGQMRRKNQNREGKREDSRISALVSLFCFLSHGGRIIIKEVEWETQLQSTLTLIWTEDEEAKWVAPVSLCSQVSFSRASANLSNSQSSSRFQCSLEKGRR